MDATPYCAKGQFLALSLEIVPGSVWEKNHAVSVIEPEHPTCRTCVLSSPLSFFLQIKINVRGSYLMLLRGEQGIGDRGLQVH